MDSNFSILITSLIDKTTQTAIMDTVSKGPNKDIVVPTTLRIKGYDGKLCSSYISSDNEIHDVRR